MSPQVALIEFFIVIYVFLVIITLFVLLVLLVFNVLLVFLAPFCLISTLPAPVVLLSSLSFLFSGAMHESSLFQLFK